MLSHKATLLLLFDQMQTKMSFLVVIVAASIMAVLVLQKVQIEE